MQQVLEQVMGDGGGGWMGLPWPSLPPAFTHGLLLFTYIHLPRPDFCPDGNEGQLPMRFEVATIEASRKDKSDKEGFNEVD